MGSVAINFVGGIPFQGLYEVVKVAVHKSRKFKTHLVNLEFTLRCIHSPTLEQIRDNYLRLNLLTDTVADLKQKVIEGKARVGELSELSMWNIRIWGNFCNCIGPDYAKELEELDRSLWSLLELLQLEQMRNMTELLCLARAAKDKQDDLEKKQDEVLTGVQELGKKVDELLATLKEQQGAIQRIKPNSVQQAPSSSGGGAANPALGVVFRQLVDAVVQVKVENLMFKRLLKTFKSTLYCLQPLIKEIAEHGRVVHLPKQEVEELTIQIVNGVEYVLKWSKVRKHSNYKKDKYTNKILNLDESLQRLFIELKGQVERNMTETMASANKIEMAIKKIEAEGLCDVQLPELPSPAIGFDILNMQGKRDVTEETFLNSVSVKEETESSSDVPPKLPSPADILDVLNMQGSMDVETRPPKLPSTAAVNEKTAAIEEAAAIKIQSVFRSYLARKAMRALKGLVKLQALVRGHLVRKQAKATLRCKQALVTAQARARAPRIRMVEDGNTVNPRPSTGRRSLQDNRLRHSYSEFDRGMIKIVEMDLGESKRNVKGRNSYSNHTQADRPESRFSTQSAPNHQPYIKPDNCSNVSPAPSALNQCHSAMFKLDPSRVPFAFPRPDYAEQLSYGYPLYPNYMANTQSSKAKARSKSAPKQRPPVAYERQQIRPLMTSINGILEQRRRKEVKEGLKCQISKSCSTYQSSSTDH